MSARRNSGAWAATGATISAVLSSACCWLPLLLLAFGASATSLSASFEALRIPLLVVTVTLLGTGFYLAYFRKPSRGPEGACCASSSRLTRLNEVALWVATLFVAAFASFPSYVGALVGVRARASVEGTVVHLDVQGMTCEGCALHVEEELRSVPGVLGAEVSCEEHRADVTVESSVLPGENLVRAVERAGYEAHLTRSAADSRESSEEGLP